MVRITNILGPPKHNDTAIGNFILRPNGSALTYEVYETSDNDCYYYHDYNSRTPLIRMLVIRVSSYPNRLCPSGKFVQNSTKLTCLEITGYRIKYSTVLWLIELQIRRGRKV
jgi:hypothetical protein